jgi:hypothetical protein
MARKKAKLNIEQFLNEQQRDEAMRAYMLARPELVEGMFEAILKQDMLGKYSTLFFTIQGKIKDVVKPILKLYEERALYVANSLAASEEFVDSLIPMDEFVDMIKADMRASARDKYYVKRVISEIVDQAVRSKIKEIVNVDPIIKTFQDKVATRIRELIAETTVDAEVDRLMGRRNK